MSDLNQSSCVIVGTSTAPISALRDLLDQLEGVGIYVPGEDEGQWSGTEGLSFAGAESTLFGAGGDAVDALRDMLDQLEGVGIYTPGDDEGQWSGTEGLSFSRAEITLSAG